MGDLKIWHRKACDKCGVEGLASRGVAVDVDAPYVCEGCEMFARGAAMGEARIAELEAENAKLRERAEPQDPQAFTAHGSDVLQLGCTTGSQWGVQFRRRGDEGEDVAVSVFADRVGQVAYLSPESVTALKAWLIEPID